MCKNRYIREKNSDVIGIYRGYDENDRPSLLVKLKNKPNIKFESKVLVSNVFLRKDQLWAFQISLKDVSYDDVFRVFITDLVDVVAEETNQLLAERKLITRYLNWEKLFENMRTEILTEEQIKGLLGELYFLNFKLMPARGVEESIESWIGPLATDKDFHYEQDWFEIKTKSTNKNTVHISNTNQLASDKLGYLTVINCERTSNLNNKSYNLNELHKLIYNKLLGSALSFSYLEKISKLGYVPSDSYEDYSYEIKNIKYYKVDELFPRILEIPNSAITGIKYELNLQKLGDFEREENEWKNIGKSL